MRRRRPRARALRLGCLALLVLCTGAVLTHAGSSLVVAAPMEAPDAILVLASHEWERLPDAASLAARYPSARVFLTVPTVVTKYNCPDCEARARRLIAAGVAAGRIVQLPQRVRNTRDEARAARAECLRLNVRRLLIVTSPYHTRRALATFQRAFEGTPVTLGIVPASASPARPARWWANAYDRAYVRYEWAAIVYHAIRDAAGRE
jgi:uncharacterized SAM-binding protein YcdF (DUF218 family)